MSKTFCPIPWIFQAVRNNGDIRVCCQANVTPNQGVVRHPDGTSFNAGRDQFDEAKNAELMKSIRKNMLDGVWSEECGRCQQEEQAGLESRRMYELRAWDYSLADAQKDTQPDGTITVRSSYYDLRFGNLCNLACRMCGPTDSHTWYEQWTEYHGSNKYQDTHGEVELKRNEKGRLYTTDYDWHNSESFWEQIEMNIPYIQHVYMAGGEPMMIERHYEFLKKCIGSGHAKNITIEYNTNMTSLPPRVLEMWKEFKQIRPKMINNRRYYSLKQIEIIKMIIFLLKNKGMTISGVRNMLNSNSNELDVNNSFGLKTDYYKHSLKLRTKNLLKKIIRLKTYGKKNTS